MASIVTGVEKEFILQSARDERRDLRIHKAGWSGSGQIALLEDDRVELSLRGALSSVSPWDALAVYFDHRGSTLVFVAKARKVLEDRIVLEMPAHLARGPKRRHVRVPAPRGFAATFILANERVRLDYPESTEYIDVAAPEEAKGFDLTNMNALIASFRQRAQEIASENSIVMFKGRPPESFEERLVARLGKVLYIPSTRSGLPVTDPYPDARLVTAAMEEDFEGPALFTEGSRLARALVDKAVSGVNAEIWCPIRYYQYIVGYARLSNSGERRVAFDLAAVDFVWEFCRILAYFLHSHDYFKTSSSKPSEPRPASLVDLSPSGCLIAVSQASLQIRLQVSALVELELKHPGGPTLARGRVARRYDDGRNAYYGISFEDLPTPERAKLHQLLYGRAWSSADDHGEAGLALPETLSGRQP